MTFRDLSWVYASMMALSASLFGAFGEPAHLILGVIFGIMACAARRESYRLDR